MHFLFLFKVKDACTQTPGECTGCQKLQNAFRQTTNKVITLKGKIREKDLLIEKFRSGKHFIQKKNVVALLN